MAVGQTLKKLLLNVLNGAREEIALMSDTIMPLLMTKCLWLLSVSNVLLKQNTSELTVVIGRYRNMISEKKLSDK